MILCNITDQKRGTLSFQKRAPLPFLTVMKAETETGFELQITTPPGGGGDITLLPHHYSFAAWYLQLRSHFSII